jgi:outer membrane protein TolC
MLSAPDTLVVNYQEIMERVFSQSPAVNIAAIEIEKSELDQKAVLGEFYPQITGQVQVTRLSEIPTFTFEIAPGFETEMSFGDEYMQTVQLGVRLPLWTYGRRLQGYALAGEAVELARLDSAEIHRQLSPQVAEIYANIIALQDAQVLTETALANSTRHRENIEEKYQKGLVSHYQLLQAQSREAELKPELVDVRQQRETLIARLAILINLDEDTVLVVEPDWELPQMPDTACSIDDVTRNRPAWQQIELGKKMIERQIKIKQRETLPVLVADGNFSVQRSPLTDGEWSTGWSYSLAAQTPISSGFTNLIEVKKLEKELQILAVQEEALKTQVRYEIQEARGAVEIAYAQLDALTLKEQEARELVLIVQKRYAEGLVSDIDLMDAELGLRKARADRVMSERDVIVASEKWMHAVGGVQ